MSLDYRKLGAALMASPPAHWVAPPQVLVTGITSDPSAKAEGSLLGVEIGDEHGDPVLIAA